MFKKKIKLAIGLIMIFILASSSIVSASPINSSKSNQLANTELISSLALLEDSTQSVQGNFNVSTVSKQQKIQEIANKFNIVTPKGKTIEKIEFCEPIDVTKNSETSIPNKTLTPYICLWKYIKSVTNRGTGWYFPSNPYMDNWCGFAQFKGYQNGTRRSFNLRPQRGLFSFCAQ